MDYTIVTEFIEMNLPLILLGIVVLMTFYTLILISVLVKNHKLKKRYEKLMINADKSSLEQMIVSYQKKIDEAHGDTALAMDQLKLLSNQMSHCIQKVGVVRFKAFDDIGSDLSYSVALLDNKNDGVIITSIFGRNTSTSYAKPIQKGISKYNLSDEEVYAMNKALGLEKNSK
jgi:hypothetical protein